MILSGMTIHVKTKASSLHDLYCALVDPLWLNIQYDKSRNHNITGKRKERKNRVLPIQRASSGESNACI